VPRALLPPAFRRLAIVLLAACAAVTASLGVWFTDQTRAGWLDQRVDARVQAGLASHRHVMNLLAGLGNPTSVAVMTAALAVVCLAMRRWRGAVLVAVAIPAAGASTEVLLKPLIDRTLQGQLSMPSGHATATFALATALAVLLVDPGRPRLPAALRLIVALGAFAGAGAVAVSLVGLGAHYFTDAVAGAAVGTGAVLAVALIVDGLGWPPGRRPRPQVAPQARRPAAQRL